MKKFSLLGWLIALLVMVFVMGGCNSSSTSTTKQDDIPPTAMDKTRIVPTINTKPIEQIKEAGARSAASRAPAGSTAKARGDIPPMVNVHQSEAAGRTVFNPPIAPAGTSAPGGGGLLNQPGLNLADYTGKAIVGAVKSGSPNAWASPELMAKYGGTLPKVPVANGSLVR